MESIDTQEVANFGKSLLVPSVQELAKEPLTHIPSRYVSHQLDCPIDQSSSLSVPVIDLHRLLHGNSMDSELDKLHFACKEWGFFQIMSNGIYRSIEHRATVNSTKERLSVATFYSSNLDSEVGPAKSIIGPKNPPHWNNTTRGFLEKHSMESHT